MKPCAAAAARLPCMGAERGRWTFLLFPRAVAAAAVVTVVVVVVIAVIVIHVLLLPHFRPSATVCSVLRSRVTWASKVNNLRRLQCILELQL